jgi:hypothetical protein
MKSDKTDPAFKNQESFSIHCLSIAHCMGSGLVVSPA